MNNSDNTDKSESNDEKFWMGVRNAALDLFTAVPEEFRDAPPQAVRWLTLREAAFLAWSALPPEYRETPTGEVRQ